MTLIICNTYNVQMCNLSSDTRQSLDIVTYYRFRKQVISFQHTISHNTIHIMRDKWRYSEGILSQGNTKAQQEKLNPVVLAQIYGSSFRGCPSPCNFSLFGYFYPYMPVRIIVLYGMSHGLGISMSCGLKMQLRLL